MKKRISLLLCALVLLLGVQSACALTISKITDKAIPSVTVNSLLEDNDGLRISSTKLGNLLPDPTVFEKGLDGTSSALTPPASSTFIRHAVGTQLTVTETGTQGSLPPSNMAISIPMNELASAGSIVQNVQVFHGNPLENVVDSPDDYAWNKLPKSALTKEQPIVVQIPSPITLDDSAPTGPVESGPSVLDNYIIKNAYPQSASAFVNSDLYLCFLTDSCSPFVIVWDEVPLYSDVPQTGDSASLAPWLLLLGGACVLLLLAKKKSAASA